MLGANLNSTIYAPKPIAAIVADVLRTSDIYISATNTLIPSRGSGIGSFTRATAAWCFDNEGKLIDYPNGAARISGARIVRNLFSSSATLASGSSATISSLTAGTYTFSMGAGTGTATFSGTGGATGTLAASTLGRVQVTKTITAGTFVVTASVATLVDIQLENVTGQSNQTASEYVSVGATSECAWFDATGTTNFPKGNNNNALKDTNDTSVVYTTDGYSNCGLTGSGLPFEKTTHNGQGSGVADLNGNVWEVSPGITCISGTKTITAATKENPVVLTIASHGRSTGEIVMITSVGGMTQINDKLFKVTVVDTDNISLDGTDGTGFSTYTSGGTLTYGTFYALNTSYAAKNLTGGNTLATDQFGATGVATHSSPIVIPFRTDYSQNDFAKRYGRGTNQVLNSSTSGDGWTLTSLGVPLATGISDGTTGSNLFGADYWYQYIRNELCLISGARWTGGSAAGVWAAGWLFARTDSGDDVGFRAASYLSTVQESDFLSVSDITRTAGVGLCPRLESGYFEMTGTTTLGHANYGNYQYSDGSVMVWIAVHYRKVDGNNLRIKSYSAYPNLAAAIADGYSIPREFYDGGVLQPGYFIDKFQCSNNSGVASSIKNAAPLSTNSAHNPIGSLTGLSSGDNIYGGVFKAAKTRGAQFFPATRFMYAGLAFLATAHGEIIYNEKCSLFVDGIKAFTTNKDGTPISSAVIEGFLSEPAATNNLLYSRDLTNAAWTKTNITTELTATGIDGVVNSASRLTATSSNGTVLQARTLASAARSSSAYVKRVTGTGTIEFTRDGGTTWVDITSNISTTGWYRAKIENSSVTNPSVGFRMGTSGDVIAVDCVQDEGNTFVTSPIITTSATVTRNKDQLSYSGVINNADGCAIATVKTLAPLNSAQQFQLSVAGSGEITYFNAGNSRALTTVYDGVATSTVTGPKDCYQTQSKRGAKWLTGIGKKAVADGVLGTLGTFDGSMGSSDTLYVGQYSAGTLQGCYIKDIHVWSTLANIPTDNNLKLITK